MAPQIEVFLKPGRVVVWLPRNDADRDDADMGEAVWKAEVPDGFAAALLVHGEAGTASLYGRPLDATVLAAWLHQLGIDGDLYLRGCELVTQDLAGGFAVELRDAIGALRGAAPRVRAARDRVWLDPATGKSIAAPADHQGKPTFTAARPFAADRPAGSFYDLISGQEPIPAPFAGDVNRYAAWKELSTVTAPLTSTEPVPFTGADAAGRVVAALVGRQEQTPPPASLSTGPRAASEPRTVSGTTRGTVRVGDGQSVTSPGEPLAGPATSGAQPANTAGPQQHLAPTAATASTAHPDDQVAPARTTPPPANLPGQPRPAPGDPVVSRRAMDALWSAMWHKDGQPERGMGRLAWWIKQVSTNRPGAWSVGDCAVLARAAMMTLGPAAAAADDFLSTGGIQSPIPDLNAQWARIGNLQRLVEALLLKAESWTVMEVRVRPPNQPSHRYLLVADNSTPHTTLRWVDPQVPGSFDTPAVVTGRDADWWGRHLASPTTRIALYGPNLEPIDPADVPGTRANSTAENIVADLDPPLTTRDGLSGPEIEWLRGLLGVRNFKKLATSTDGLMRIDSDGSGGVILEIVAAPALQLDDEVHGADPEALFKRLSDINTRLAKLKEDTPLKEFFPDFEPELGEEEAWNHGKIIGKSFGELAYVQHTAGVPKEGLHRFYKDLLEYPVYDPDDAQYGQAVEYLDQGLAAGEDFALKLFGGVQADFDTPGPATTVAGYLALLYTHFAAQTLFLDPKLKVRPKNYLLFALREDFHSALTHLPVEIQLLLQANGPAIKKEFVDYFESENPAFVDGLRRTNGADFDLLNTRLTGGGGVLKYTLDEYLDNGLVRTPTRLISPYDAFRIKTWFPKPDTNNGQLKHTWLYVGELRIFGTYRTSSSLTWENDHAWLRTTIRRVYRWIVSTRAPSGGDAVTVNIDASIGNLNQLKSQFAQVGSPSMRLGVVVQAAVVLLTQLREHPDRLNLAPILLIMNQLPEGDRDEAARAAIESVHIRLDWPIRSAVKSVDTAGPHLAPTDFETLRGWFPKAIFTVPGGGRTPPLGFVQDSDKFPAANSPPRRVDIAKLITRLNGLARAAGGRFNLVDNAWSMAKLIDSVGISNRADQPTVDEQADDEQALRDVAFLAAALYGADFTAAHLTKVRRLTHAPLADGQARLVMWSQLQDIVRHLRGDDPTLQPKAPVDPAHIQLLLHAIPDTDTDTNPLHDLYRQVTGLAGPRTPAATQLIKLREDALLMRLAESAGTFRRNGWADLNTYLDKLKHDTGVDALYATAKWTPEELTAFTATLRTRAAAPSGPDVALPATAVWQPERVSSVPDGHNVLVVFLPDEVAAAARVAGLHPVTPAGTLVRVALYFPADNTSGSTTVLHLTDLPGAKSTPNPTAPKRERDEPADPGPAPKRQRPDPDLLDHTTTTHPNYPTHINPPGSGATGGAQRKAGYLSGPTTAPALAAGVDRLGEFALPGLVVNSLVKVGEVGSPHGVYFPPPGEAGAERALAEAMLASRPGSSADALLLSGPALRGAHAGTTDQVTRHLIDELTRAVNPVAHLAPYHTMFGPDLFGLRQAPPRPPVLANIVQAMLPTDQIGGLVDHLDMARLPSSVSQPPSVSQSIWSSHPTQRNWWSPEVDTSLVETGQIVPLAPVQEMPLLKHTIWLGGPLTRPDFLAKITATAEMLRPHGWKTVLWTDVPRNAFNTVDEMNARAGRVPAELDDVAKMLNWARSNGVRLVNVDEVFHAEEPMRLNDYYRSEMAKHNPRGYTAASDILRLEILFRFGALYGDPDNRMNSLNGLRELFDVMGLAIQYVSITATEVNVINSVLLAARNHPFIRLYLEAIKVQYNQMQDTILGPEIVNAAPHSFGTRPMHIRRNSVLGRTGPYPLAQVLTDSGYYINFQLPHFSRDVFTVESAQSWISTSPLDPIRQTAPKDAVRTLQGVIATTYRDIAYRDGKAHATSYASVINSLPDPAAGWRAWAEFLLAQPGVRERWKGITLGIAHPGPDNQLTTSWVELPTEVYNLLGIQGATGYWQAGECHIPINTTVAGPAGNSAPAAQDPAAASGEMPHRDTQPFDRAQTLPTGTTAYPKRPRESKPADPDRARKRPRQDPPSLLDHTTAMHPQAADHLSEQEPPTPAPAVIQSAEHLSIPSRATAHAEDERLTDRLTVHDDAVMGGPHRIALRGVDAGFGGPDGKVGRHD